MLISTRDSITDRKILREIGLVRGHAVTSRFIFRDFVAGIRNVLGKRLLEYEEVIDNAIKISTENMIKDAEKKGANAILTTRVVTSEVSGGAAEVIIFGTGVVLE